jgi:hypothetical protein
MATKEHFHRSTKRTLKEFGNTHRIAGLIALFVVAMFGAAHWLHAGSRATTTDSTPRQTPAGNVQSQVEYFPSQYVNQATQPEKHIEAF